MAPDTQKFLSVLRGLMRPLVRTLISRGVTAPTFYKLLKSVYVDVAYSDFRIDEAPPTDSRVTLLTGVHRRDVRAILSEDGTDWEDARAKTAMFATVLGQWLARPEYRDENGGPKPLPRNADEGESFEALVRSINKDIRPRTILDELLRQNLVVEDGDQMLRVSDAAVHGPSSDDDRLVFFATNVGDHLAAASENLLAEKPPFYERAVFYNQMTAEAVDEIEAQARDLSQKLLVDLNQQSSELHKATAGQEDATERYRFGIYFYRETVDKDDEATKDKTREDD